MTTLDELSAALPNGFHDAELQSIVIDFGKREARLTLDVWIGDMNAEAREVYRPAEVHLSGLVYWVAEAPHAGYFFDVAEAERIDVGPLAARRDKAPTLPPLPDGAFANWIFFAEWNAFHYVAARDAVFTWLGDKAARE